ncbi:tudor domain-containing protein 5 [Phaenicophaeus curvirostris]|uniref:tudor domain-containing protein 5 n=1 Tax=Phaenicophaeus curvirostris TaxID=33595 RepID=UPI0037F0E9B8
MWYELFSACSCFPFSADMSKQGDLMELLKKEVRSLLITDKEGLTPAQLERDYMAMIGKPLPLRDLGFQSTLELVAKMPDVVRICPQEKGTFILKAIADETTKGIAKLVARQEKSAKSRKNDAVKARAAFPSRNTKCLPRKASAPVLPAAVKAELQDLLSSSPLLLGNFERAYRRRFGRLFQYRRYGFVSMFQVLESVSDIIVVEQTKAGSLLTLRKYLEGETAKEEVPQGGAQEEEVAQKEVPEAAPAIEMPPLEPIHEAKWFHLPAEEKSEPVEGQALDMGDVLKQCQDLDLKLSIFNLATTPEIPPDAVQDRSLCSLPPLERLCLVGVFVECIISPSQFYIQVCHAETSDKLQDMMFEMRHCYLSKLVSDRYVMPESSVRPGQLCCVTVSKWWYRVIIHRVINDQEVEVFYADYGNLGIVQRSRLRFLKWCYLKLPAQAIPCSLAWVKPVGGSWSNDAILLFKKLCDSKLLVGIVDEYVNGICHLFLCDTTTKDDIYFHTVLSSRGCADVCGKNVPSQGFEEVNPSALYLEPSRKQENAEPVEPHLRLQQESLNINSDIASSKLDEDELWEQVRWHLSAEEELEEDVWPALDEASVQRTTDGDPEPAQEDTKESPPELITEAKTRPSLEESSIPVVLVKPVEDIYTYSRQPRGMSQDDPDQTERFPNEAQCLALHPAVLLMAAPFMLDDHNNFRLFSCGSLFLHASLCSFHTESLTARGKEEVRNKGLPRSPEAGLCGASGLCDQAPSLKLLVPPVTLAALFPAARLATCGSYLQWFPGLRKNLRRGEEAGATAKEGCLE